jgi:predicted NBD/HSP70 family sugar kinase
MPEKVTATTEIKRANRTSIFQLLRKRGGLSKQDIVATLRLSLPTVTVNIDTLVAEGLVRESGSLGNTGGRKARAYSIVSDARLAIGLDLTRHYISAVVVDLTGKVINRIRLDHDFSQTDRYYRTLGKAVTELVNGAGLEGRGDRILGVGIGVPGLVTPDHQRVFWGGPLNFTGATCADFSRYIPYEASLHNDANAAGFAEIWGREDISNAFYIMLSNFIGGSVLINNRIYPGENIRGGEIGHLTIIPNGKPCYCGQRGHVDPYLAATVLSDLCGGNLETFFTLLKSGDRRAKSLFRQYLNHLAIAVINLRVLFDCSIILGGYVGAYMDDYMDDLRAKVLALNPFESDCGFIKPCRYKTESIAAGSALHYSSLFLGGV